MSRRRPTPGQHPALRQAAVVFSVALAARLLHFAAMGDSLLYDALVGDAWRYDEWAREIAGGDWLGSEVFYQTPLYPYLMGTLYALFGADPWVVRIAQALFGALACVCLARAGAHFFSQRVGWIAGLLLALYPPAIFFDGILQKASLDLLLVAALLWAIGATPQRPRLRAFFGVGALLGALILNRENAVALVPVLAAWTLWTAWPALGWSAAARAAVFAGGLAVVLVPVGLRNLHVGGELLLTTSQLGPNFFIGNQRGADGGYTPMRAGRGDPRYERHDARMLAEEALGRPLDPSEVSGYWLDRSWDEIRSDPGGWLRLLAWKAFLTWNAAESIDAESLYTHQRLSPLLGALGRGLHFGVLVPLAAAGLWWTRRDWRRLWPLIAFLLAFSSAVALFYMFSRYRYPLVPATALFAAAGLAGLFDAARGRAPERRRDAAVAIALALLLAVPSNWPVPRRYHEDAITFYNAGTTLLEAGRLDDAEALLERARQTDPGFAETWNNLGRLALARGDVARARELFERALEIDPEHALLHLNLASALSMQGEAAPARAHLERAVALDPLLAPAWRLLGRLELQGGETAPAVASLRRAAALEPDSAGAHADLAVALLVEREIPGAVAALGASLRLDPANPAVAERLAWILAAAPDDGVRDGARAVALMEPLALAPGDGEPRLLATLAAAYAESGRFDEALATVERALAGARAAGYGELAQALEAQARHYAEGRPLRDADLAPTR
jgi:tetratricopeptide (TPR) repeat protein